MYRNISEEKEECRRLLQALEDLREIVQKALDELIKETKK